MSESGEIYTAGKNFTLPPAVAAVTNSTSVLSPIITLPCLSLSFKLKIGQDIKVEFAHLSRP